MLMTLAAPCFSAFAIVGTPVANSTATSSGWTLDGSVAVGDMVYVAIASWGEDTDCVSGVSDTLSNTYARVYITPNQGLTERAYLYYSEVTSAGTPDVSITHSCVNNVPFWMARGTKDAGTLSVLSNTANGASAAATVTVNSVPANSLMLGTSVTNGAPSTPSGYTNGLANTSFYYFNVDYLADSGAAGNKTAQWSASTTFTIGLAAFSVSAGGSSAVPIILQQMSRNEAANDPEFEAPLLARAKQ